MCSSWLLLFICFSLNPLRVHSQQPQCGDGTCDGFFVGEDCNSCPEDCGCATSTLFCSPGETCVRGTFDASCIQDPDPCKSGITNLLSLVFVVVIDDDDDDEDEDLGSNILGSPGHGVILCFGFQLIYTFCISTLISLILAISSVSALSPLLDFNNRRV